MAVEPLPQPLRIRLADLGRRLRRQHLVQGSCRIALILLMAAFCAVILDGLLTLPGWSRGLLFVGWLALGFWEIRRFVRGPLRQPLDPEGLAAAIELEYPRLGERLTTAVELAGNDDPAHGSPHLIGMIVNEAEIRTRKLDLDRAAPARTTLGFAVAGVIAIVAVLVPLVAVPKAAEHARRFFLPWYTPAPDLSYLIKVTSGDPTVKRGDSTTLSAVIEPTKTPAELPTSATALIKTAQGVERVPMIFDSLKREAYLTRGPLDSDFDYQIVSGPLESEWHHVTVVDPVRLESARISIAPPAYARQPGKEPSPLDGLAEMAALQFSTIAIELRFNRVPSTAWLEWRPEVGVAGRAAPPKIAISPNADGTAAVTVRALAAGEYRLFAEADRLKTAFRPMPLRVALDAPPEFNQVSGIIAQPRAVRPGDKLVVGYRVTDDYGIGKLGMEVRIAGAPERFLPFTVKTEDPRNAEGKFELDLAGLAKDGEKIEYRLIAIDNRSVPEAKLQPQASYYPPNGAWAALQLSANAPPLKQQEIVANQQAIESRLQAILDGLKREQRIAYRLKTDNAKLNALKEAEADKLEELRRDVRDTADGLLDLARDTAVSPDLARLADASRGIADHDVRPAEAALRQAQRDEMAEPRTESLRRADQALESAIRKVQALLLENERLAKERLDRQKIEDLADRQTALADETDKTDKDKLAALQAKQKELEDLLNKLQNDSEPLRQALRALRQQQLEQTARQVENIEQQLRDLTQAMKNVEQSSRETRLASLLKRQQDLAARAQALAEQTGMAARTAPLSPLKPEEIARAANALKDGNLNDAVDQQEKAAFELDRLAKELENAVARARDPREAARLLERLQEDLRRQLEETVKQTPLDQLPKERRDAFTQQQRAIEKAAAKLSVPADAAEAVATRKQAVELAQDANDSLAKADAAEADDRMQKSRDALARLAEQMPTQEKRLATARLEVAKLKQEQDALAKLVEQTVKSLEKQDPDAAETQQELARKADEFSRRELQVAERLRKLDVPGHEERRERTERTVRQAKGDLDLGRAQDAIASQQAARRELERLEQAIAGQTPADEEADRLAKKQKDIAEAMKRNADKPDAVRSRELQQLQAEQTKDLQKLQAPEAATAKDDALALSRQTESAASPDEAAAGAELAAQALRRLADQLNNRESEPDKADRLAKKQKQAADDADRLAKKKEAQPELRKKAQQLLDEAKTLRPGADGQKDKQQAVEALTRAQQAAQPEQLAQAERDAAVALERLADKMRLQPPVERPQPRVDDSERLQGLPTKAQAEEARRLADEQRLLRDELARANEKMGKEPKSLHRNPLEELLKEQEKIAKDSLELAKKSNPDAKADQAVAAARQTAERMRLGEIPAAREAGAQTSQKFKQLEQSELPNMPRQEAGELAKRQEEVNRKLGELMGNTRAAQAQQTERQKDLQQQTMELSQRLDRLNQRMKNEGASGGKTDEAAMRLKQADDAMKNARDQNAKGNRDMARNSQEMAADVLRQASQDLKDAAKQMPKDPSGASPSPSPQAGQAAENARERMERAQLQLGQRNPEDARDSMQQAAQALRQAAKQMGRPANQPPAGDSKQGGQEPGGNDGSSMGPTDFGALSPLADKFKGKSWGDLSGEIRNQIISDFKARYGEDYAKFIKLYFEQLAERK